MPCEWAFLPSFFWFAEKKNNAYCRRRKMCSLSFLFVDRRKRTLHCRRKVCSPSFCMPIR